jgi:hypothetical protein
MVTFPASGLPQSSSVRLAVVNPSQTGPGVVVIQEGDVVFLSLLPTKCSAVVPSALNVDPLLGVMGTLGPDLQVLRACFVFCSGFAVVVQCCAGVWLSPSQVVFVFALLLLCKCACSGAGEGPFSKGTV